MYRRKVTSSGGREVTSSGGGEVTSSGGGEVTSSGGGEVTSSGGGEVTSSGGGEVTSGEGRGRETVVVVDTRDDVIETLTAQSDPARRHSSPGEYWGGRY